MNENDGPPWTMGQFARLAGVTPRALRHYHAIGVLKPSGRTDAGYRLYDNGDLVRAKQITALRFVGFTLSDARKILAAGALPLDTALRLQRQILEEQHQHMHVVLAALDNARDRLDAGVATVSDVCQPIMEAMKMRQNTEWTKTYYTEQQLQDLQARATPAALERGQQDWADLIRDVEAALGSDPAGAPAQALLQRRDALIEQFTGGDPGICEGLQRLYADRQHWPETFQKPYSDEIGHFIERARDARPGQ